MKSEYQENLAVARLRETQRRVRISWAVNCGCCRGEPPYVLSDPKGKLYRKIGSQFSAAPERM